MKPREKFGPKKEEWQETGKGCKRWRFAILKISKYYYRYQDRKTKLQVWAKYKGTPALFLRKRNERHLFEDLILNKGRRIKTKIEDGEMERR